MEGRREPGHVGSGRRQAEGCRQRDSRGQSQATTQSQTAEGISLSGWPLVPPGPPGQSSRTRLGPGSTGVRCKTSRTAVTTRRVSGGAADPPPRVHRPRAHGGLSSTARTVGMALGPRHPARRPTPRGQSRPEGTWASEVDADLESHPRPPRFPAGRPLPGRLLTRERGEAECLPPPMGLTRESQWEESRHLGQWNRGWGQTEGPRGGGHLTPIRPPTEKSTELGRPGARKDATRPRSPEALAVRSRRRG